MGNSLAQKISVISSILEIKFDDPLNLNKSSSITLEGFTLTYFIGKMKWLK